MPGPGYGGYGSAGGRSRLDVGNTLGTLGRTYCDSITDGTLRALCKAGTSLIPTGGTGGSDGRTSTGGTVVTTDPTPGTVTPGEASVGAVGLQLPYARTITRHECPRFMNGKGILWMHPQTGGLVCLPRGCSGAPYGLVRKNPKRAKAPISAAEWKVLKAKTSKSLKKFSRELAKVTGTR